jgi:hypothetical protein
MRIILVVLFTLASIVSASAHKHHHWHPTLGAKHHDVDMGKKHDMDKKPVVKKDVDMGKKMDHDHDAPADSTGKSDKM